MLRCIALIAAAAAATLVAAPLASAQSVSYGSVHYAGPPGPYVTNPGPYGGYAPIPSSYGFNGPYGALVTRSVAYSLGDYYGNEYGGGPYSGPFRTDSAPLSGGGY